MAEVYKKQYTSNTTVLGSYNNGATTKMCFATSYRKQVHLASGKMSKGSEPKFLYKMDLTMKLSELQAMIEARVRIARIKNNTFEKSSLRRWVKEIFIVVKVFITDPVTYKLKDTKGEDIEGIFYREELQTVS
jgi:hypothetical protein